MNYYNMQTSNLEQYIVKPGDSLYMIAKKYGLTVDEIKQTNHLVTNVIYPNQVLFIKKENNNNINLTKPNDCVSDLINKYSLTLTEISNIKVMPNQPIIARENNCYIIQPNDTLEEILMKFELTPSEFLKLNKHKFINTGEKIIIK